MFFGQRVSASELSYKVIKGHAVGVTAVYLLLSVMLVVPFACLALLSFVAFLGVASIAVGLNLIRTAKSALGMAKQQECTALSVAFADAHPLDYVEPNQTRRERDRAT